MRANNTVDLGSGSVRRLLFTLSVPTITSQIVNMLYNLVDRIYIGHMQPAETVGKLALTGVGVCLPIILVISAFAALLASGGAPRASIAEGRGDSKESERIMGNSFSLLVITAVVLGGTLNTGGKGSILGTVLASLIICILRYGLPLCFGVSTQNLDLPVGIILVLVVLGREIAGQHMLSDLFKRLKK